MPVVKLVKDIQINKFENHSICPVCGKPWTARATVDGKGYVWHGTNGRKCQLTKEQTAKENEND